MMRALGEPMDEEQQVALPLLITARWALIAVSALALNYRADVVPSGRVGINLLIAGAGLINLALHLSYRRGPVVLWLPLTASVYDAAAVVGSVGLVDGFRSGNYILLFPSLLAFALVFPGRLSTGYTGLVLLAYTIVATTSHASFRPGS